jgi:hypothetical protein
MPNNQYWSGAARLRCGTAREDITHRILRKNGAVDGLRHKNPRNPADNAGNSTERSIGIFDTFANEGSRNAHLTGEIAKALGARANELLAVPPQIEKVEVLASTPLKG